MSTSEGGRRDEKESVLDAYSAEEEPAEIACVPNDIIRLRILSDTEVLFDLLKTTKHARSERLPFKA